MLTRAEVRQELLSITDATAAEVAAMFSQVRGLTRSDVREFLADSLAVVGDEYEAVAASLAADHYDDVRAARGVRGFFSAVIPDPATEGRWGSLADWGTRPLLAEVPDWLAAEQLVAGGLQRTVVDAHRNTVALSSALDPKAVGWQRQTSPGGCEFCLMLAGRGDTYTEETASFLSHDNCHCWAETVFL